MSAANLVQRLAREGVRLEARGDRLHVEARPGILTRELRDMLANRKADLLAHLSGRNAETRNRLLDAARTQGIDPALIHRLKDADLDECVGLPDEVLHSYALALHDTAERNAGRVPAGYTARALCRHCGPIWLPPETVAVAPQKSGWPVVLGCPWCSVKGHVPRPPVTCADCKSFQRDTINPEGGMGTCACEGRGRYPNEQHHCGEWRPKP